MSAQDANPGITEVPPRIYQPLPELTADLFVVHYSSDPLASDPNQTPRVSAIVVQHVLSGNPWAFAAFTEAEARGIPPTSFLERFPELEADMLEAFTDFTVSHPTAIWMHWGMREAFFGFDVLARRARVYNLMPHIILPERRFDLAHHLAQRFGDDFAPSPRLWHAARRNLGVIPDLLNEEATVVAWQRGEHGADLRSLYAKVDAIAKLYERVRLGQFRTGAADLNPAISLRPGTVSDDSQNDSVLLAHDPTGPTSGASSNLPLLTSRHLTILDELLERKAFDQESSMTTATLATGVDGPGAKTGSFKEPVAELVGWGLIKTAEGRKGGVWLTPEGRSLAEQRRRAGTVTGSVA